MCCMLHFPGKTPPRAWGRKQSSAVEKLLLAIVANIECIVSILLKAPFPHSLHPRLGLAIIYLNLTVVLNGEISFKKKWSCPSKIMDIYSIGYKNELLSVALETGE